MVLKEHSYLSSGMNIKPRKKTSRGLCLPPSLFFDTEDGGNYSLKDWWTFNRLHGFISQKIECFPSTAVK
jgi:hypothetical protein